MFGHQRAALQRLGVAPRQRLGVGLGDGVQHLGLLAQRANGGNACLGQTWLLLKHASPLLLQVGAPVQFWGDQAEGERFGFAQRQRHCRFGQQSVRDAPGDQQLHGLHRRGHIAQAKVLLRIQPLFGRQQLQQDVGHIAAKRHGNFFAPVVGQCLAFFVAGDDPQRAPGGHIQQRDACAAVKQVGRDVAGHGQHVGFAAHGHHAQLIGVAPRHKLGAPGNVGQRIGFGHVDERRRDDGRRARQGDALAQRRSVRQRWQAGGAQSGQRGQHLAARNISTNKIQHSARP